MFVAGIKHQTTGYGKCVPRPLLSPINYLAELHWGMSLGLRARQTPFEADTAPHVRLSDVARRWICRTVITSPILS